MRIKSLLFLLLTTALATAVYAQTKQNEIKNKSAFDLIKAYDVDFNLGEGGPNAFAKPGLWNDADPIEQVDWYYEMGCNVITPKSNLNV